MTAPELNVENSILSVFLITILLLIVSPSCQNWVSGAGVTNQFQSFSLSQYTRHCTVKDKKKNLLIRLCVL